MTFPPANDNGFTSVAELLAALPQLGIPHFQRGQVWRDQSVAKLLESLMLDTPCGSIILWEPVEELSEVGEPVSQWGSSNPRYLVVDGQQRLTALSQALANDSTWALNLAAFPQFRADAFIAPNRQQRERGKFVPLPRDPRLSGSDSPSASRVGRYESDVRDLVAISAITSQGQNAWPYPSTPNEAWGRLVDGICQIRERNLQVVIKRGDPLLEIVNLYNRINSSGIAVRQEERAFAAMVGLHPGTSTWLREIFDSVHQVSATDGDAFVTRNMLVKREREQRFGFPLFIKTFAQTVAHHLDEGGVDMAIIDKLVWNGRWNADPDAQVRVFDEASRVITSTARILRDHLKCDDYRFLPAAEPLRPVFALQLRFPHVDDSVVASAILRLQLKADVTPDRLSDVQMIRRIRAANHLAEALAALPTVPSEQAVLASLDGARTIQDPWVLLLYWYLRSRHARDYGPDPKLAGDPRVYDEQLTVASHAHREHIVPYSLLHPAYDDLDARGQNRAHVVNSIGNLTCISADFNYAHGAEPVRFDEANEARREAHQLSDPKIRTAYNASIAALAAQDFDLGRRAFDEFRNLRVRLLARGMHEWIRSFDITDQVDLNERPMRQLIQPSHADTVRDHRWPTGFEDAVHALTPEASANPRKPYWVLWRTGVGRERQTTRHQVRLTTDGRQLKVGFEIDDATAIVAQLERVLPSTQWESEWVFQLDPSMEDSAAALRELMELRPR